MRGARRTVPCGWSVTTVSWHTDGSVSEVCPNTNCLKVMTVKLLFHAVGGRSAFELYLPVCHTVLCLISCERPGFYLVSGQGFI